MNFPPKSDEYKQTLRGWRGMWWLVVLLLLAAVLVFLYRQTDLLKPGYNAVGMYHPPDSRAIPEPGSQLSASFKPAGQPPLKTDATKTAAPPAAKQAPAPLAAPPPAARTLPVVMVPKPVDKPVQKEQPTPSPVAVIPVPAPSPQKSGLLPVAAAVPGDKKSPRPIEAQVPPKPVKLEENGGTYTLLIGEFSAGQETEKIRATLKKLGISAIHETQINRADPMHRLFLAHYDNRQAADAELLKLRQLAPGAFIATENGAFAVYAGSYLSEKRADAELQRLAEKNITLQKKTIEFKVSLTRITTGSFSGSAAAYKKAERLKKQGVIAMVIRVEQ